MTLTDRIVIMQGGAIQQIGTPDEIYSDPANSFVAGFIGAPPMNVIDGEIKDGTFTSPVLKWQAFLLAQMDQSNWVFALKIARSLVKVN
ncbi:MAG: hypothetical protein P8M25_07545, partial [Paracoccaceae bacterium]|nr:hypothetical protein [Paracoccaceae bacterium]